MLDTGSRGGEDAAFEDAVAVAASFVYTIDTQECLLDLLFVGGEVHHSTAGRGQLHAEQHARDAGRRGPSAPEAFGTLAHAVLAQARQLTSCILVLVDWDEARRASPSGSRRAASRCARILVCARDAPREPRRLAAASSYRGRVEAGLARLERRVLR